ncbi:hypothetical protein AAKU55_005640 [Oxalobacteraceae bacterium GrIS 1.11]
MKYLITFLAASCLANVAFATGPIEKIEQSFPKNIGEFQFINKTLIPAKTNRVSFVYKAPGKSNAVITITALNPERESVEIDEEFNKIMIAYSKSEPTRIVSKLPDFSESQIAQGCGPHFRQLSF